MVLIGPYATGICKAVFENPYMLYIYNIYISIYALYILLIYCSYVIYLISSEQEHLVRVAQCTKTCPCPSAALWLCTNCSELFISSAICRMTTIPTALTELMSVAWSTLSSQIKSMLLKSCFCFSPQWVQVMLGPSLFNNAGSIHRCI